MYKHYVQRLKYHLWRLSRAAELVLRPEEKTHKEYAKVKRSQDIMKAALRHLDRLPPEIARSDAANSWFVGVIPHEWEKRINERIQKKESDNAVD